MRRTVSIAPKITSEVILMRLRLIRQGMRHIMEEQAPQWFYWLPVFLAIGIGAYFSLQAEPPVWLTVFSFLLAMSIAAALWPRVQIRRILVSFCIIVCGFGAAQLRTQMVHTPMLEREVRAADVSGRILALESLEEGQGARVLLGDLEIEGLSAAQTPRRVRLKLRDDTGLRPDQRIEVLAGLHPPSPPLAPGAFDFRRYMYFQGIGAVGFVYRDAQIIDVGAGNGVRGAFEQMRFDIQKRIEAALSPRLSGMVQALMIGRRHAVSEEDQEAMRSSGLAHLLAISGLHVGLFSGFIFFVLRFAMASFPGFALEHPIKKYAAVLGIAAAVIYMLLAGASIPTQRALLMTGVVFLAIILDRSPVSLRLVTFAAFVVLLLSPESLTSASFHMSFAAVAALVVFYDFLRPYWSAWHRKAGPLRRAALYFLGVCMTTVIATLATAPFALFHFQQLALYSLPANALAMPLMAFMIMPVAVFAFLLMPFGLEGPALQIMGLGIDWLLEVAHWAAGMPHAVFRVAAWPVSSLLWITMGVLFFLLWRGAGRFIGVLPILIGLVIISQYKQPDILISSDFKLTAYRRDNGAIMVNNTRAEKFVRQNWERQWGQPENSAEKWPGEARGYDDMIGCDAHACRLQLKGRRISYIKTLTAQGEECNWADIVLSPERLSPDCPAPIVLDHRSVWSGGAAGIWLSGRDTVLRQTGHETGRRPWMHGR